MPTRAINQELFPAAIETARSTPFHARPGRPTPTGYYGALFSPGAERSQHERKRLGYYRDLFRVAGIDPAGLSILEAGSGFGIGLISVACLGAGHVTGVELVDWQAEWARDCVARLDPRLSTRITVCTGDVGSLPVSAGSTDVLLSLEAISHYLDYRPFLVEAGRVLKPGGTLIVSDGNNIRNAKIRRHTEEMWAEHEADPRIAPKTETAEDYDPWQLVEHRRRIVGEAAPALGEDETWQLALNTAGMVRREIAEAVERYVATGVGPDQPYRPGTLVVDPDQEIVIERLFDPYELADEIAAHGFTVEVRGHFGGASGRSKQIANDALASLGRLTMRWSRGFRIIATKS